jgi:hypothetical protein
MHVRLYKMVKLLQLIFNLNGFDIKHRFDSKYLTEAVMHVMRSSMAPRSALGAPRKLSNIVQSSDG